ncbi:RNA polymerase sigma factor [Actinoplanes teichomyceticus]|uniref:RNA polymerase sigma factor (Sigma-70 family) n=1 Tax=Actinoplanes teichomyceticus TaxID=1867 RepID=A0A561VMX6_ACTTI|nr:sigma-70 family RNA polymerase sigma factor [Actinoplanes teichomyceticus]TWG12953.1 RNA polymerase sigma factor (sigma-70 family) [Actinoplanes teichomyceticus]GIF16965.1 RNA polymerase sigma factor [Actinoplanes teichomyceticus]
MPEGDLATLVAAAAAGDTEAWNTLVSRYGPLVHATCRRWRLNDADAADVSQTVWLRLVENLDRLREPQALPGWLMTTATRECTRQYRAQQRERPDDPAVHLDRAPDDGAGGDAVDGDLLRHERDAALRAAFAELPEHCRQLLGLLMRPQPIPYADISARLGMPCGAIGPNRARCLERLRRSPALRALLTDAD